MIVRLVILFVALGFILIDLGFANHRTAVGIVDLARDRTVYVRPDELGAVRTQPGRLRGRKLYTGGGEVRRSRWWERAAPYPLWMRLLMAACCGFLAWEPLVDVSPW